MIERNPEVGHVLNDPAVSPPAPTTPLQRVPITYPVVHALKHACTHAHTHAHARTRTRTHAHTHWSRPVINGIAHLFGVQTFRQTMELARNPELMREMVSRTPSRCRCCWGVPSVPTPGAEVETVSPVAVHVLQR